MWKTGRIANIATDATLFDKEQAHATQATLTFLQATATAGIFCVYMYLTSNTTA